MKLKSEQKKLLYYVVIPVLLTIVAVFVTAGMAPVGGRADSAWRGFPVAWWHWQTYEILYPIPVTEFMTFSLLGFVEDLIIFYVVFAGLIYLGRKVF
jgi:hypothetical protein